MSNSTFTGPVQIGDETVQNIQWGSSSELENEIIEKTLPIEGDEFPTLLNHYMRQRFGNDGTDGKIVKLIHKKFALTDSEFARQTVGNWLRSTKPIQPREWWKVAALTYAVCPAKEDADRMLVSAGHMTIAERRSQRERGMALGDGLADRVENEILEYWLNQSLRVLMIEDE